MSGHYFIKLLLFNNKTKTCFFFVLFPFGGSVLCKCVCKHSSDSGSPMTRAVRHTSKETLQPNSVCTRSPHPGRAGSDRKQVIHLFVLRSHENICFIQKLNTVIVLLFSSRGWVRTWLRSLGKRRASSIGLDNNTCAAFGKTTDILQQSKITRVTEAQRGRGGEWREGERKGHKEGGKQWGNMF